MCAVVGFWFLTLLKHWKNIPHFRALHCFQIVPIFCKYGIVVNICRYIYNQVQNKSPILHITDHNTFFFACDHARISFPTPLHLTNNDKLSQHNSFITKTMLALYFGSCRSPSGVNKYNGKLFLLLIPPLMT